MLRIVSGSKWCQWVGSCISSPHFSIVMSASLKGFFTRSKGLHEGDLLSPFRLTMAIERMRRMLDRVSDLSWPKGPSVRVREDKEIIHPHFENDNNLM